MTLLVTGAAGYIGSVVTELLLDQGRQVVALDNLAHGNRDAVDPRATFVEADLLDRDSLRQVFMHYPVDAVVHLAAEALVDESMRDPGRFFRANVTGGINLLDAMVDAGILRMVFSSTAAVFGQPEQIPITEESPKEPVNTYGESKLQFERAMKWYRLAHGLRHVSFRYFNACGATEKHGEWRRRETHIIPILFEVVLGQREKFTLFGTDYPTVDGTCVRDYLHVRDISLAHTLALDHIDRLEERYYNLGNGRGYSNRQVVDAVREVTGADIQVVEGARRSGDPATLIAASNLIRRELGWQPETPDLIGMVRSAWNWRQAHPRGYDA